jgi:hypothetical protein
MFIKAQRALHVKWDEFLRPFTRRLWMLQLLSMILIGLCFGVTYHVGQSLGIEAGVASIFQNLYDALFYTFASFCQQGKMLYAETHNLQPQIILLLHLLKCKLLGTSQYEVGHIRLQTVYACV